jgi:hypothetical protein
MRPVTFLTIVRAENGFVIKRGNNESFMEQRYACESNETVLDLVKEHVESFTPVDNGKAGMKVEHEEHYNIEETR